MASRRTNTTAKKEAPAKRTTVKSTARTTGQNVATKSRAAKKTTRKSAVDEDMEDSSFNTLPSVSIPGLSNRKLSKRTIAIGATLIVLAGLLYLLGKYAIIAWVDNKPITRLQLFQNLEQRYGKDAREQLIVEQLILSEARKRNLSVSNADIEAEIKKIEEQQGGKEQLDQILQVQGIAQGEFKNLVKLQLMRSKIFGEGVNITDEDVNKYIEQNKENIPTATEGATQADKDKLKNDVRDQLKQQQISQKFNEWLQATLQSERVRRS